MIRRMLQATALLAMLAAAGPAGVATPATVRRGHPASLPATAAWPTARPEVLGFIADDYARAIAEARARGVPVFIESWAPW